jgi:hypothetical protein
MRHSSLATLAFAALTARAASGFAKWTGHVDVLGAQSNQNASIDSFWFSTQVEAKSGCKYDLYLNAQVGSAGPFIRSSIYDLSEDRFYASEVSFALSFSKPGQPISITGGNSGVTALSKTKLRVWSTIGKAAFDVTLTIDPDNILYDSGVGSWL